MNKALTALISRLGNTSPTASASEYSHGFVETLANGYEKARNALEYRADNLVRRAAIERILKRLMLLHKNPDEVAQNLAQELSWAKYLNRNQIKSENIKKLSLILKKYITYSGSIPHDWVVKIASAEIEEFFNLNKDYSQFTFFSFQVIKQKVNVVNDDLDLLVYFAVDNVYAASDPEQIAYHIINLAGGEINKAQLEEGWKLFNKARESPLLPRLNKFVRQTMAPLVLLRDIYFYSPSEFKNLVKSPEKFNQKAQEVLDIQLKQMSKKISTAGLRSIIYVFLTKMVFAFGLETPFETIVYRKILIIPLAINLLFPPLLMWIATKQIKIPSIEERQSLIKRTLYLTQNFESLKEEEDNLNDVSPVVNKGLTYTVFSGLYVIVFIGIFVFIYYILGLIGFKLFNKMIFVFFLTIVTFFAYKINQIARVYSWKERQNTSSIKDMISLPILTIGSLLSQGLTKLNFLGFIFDFILEAPFKIILGFVDDWVQFLSAKKEQQIFD